MAERKIQIVIDVVQSGSGATKVKSAIAGIEGEVKASQKRISDHAKHTNRVIEDSDKSQARIKRTLAKQQADDFIRELRRVEHERRRVEAEAKKSGGVFGGVFAGSFLGSAAAQGVSALTSQLSEAGRAVFEFSSKLEQTKIGFTSLMGNAALASEHLRELQMLSTDFPLEFTSIAKMSQRLQGAGIEAKKIVPLIRDIGNIAAATGGLGAERMEGLGVALSQIASKGRVSAEEMEQLAERSVPAWRILSEAIGKTAAETRKMAEKGEISAQQLFDAFQKFSRLNFGDAMKRQANTFSGSMQQIKNVLLLTAATAFEPLYKEISSIAVRANRDIQKQKGDFSRMGSTLGSAMGEAFGVALGAGIRAALLDLSKMMSGPITGDYGGFFNSLFGLGRGAASGLGGVSRGGQVGNIIPNYTRPGSPTAINPGTLAGAGVPSPSGPRSAAIAEKLPPLGSMKNLVLSTGNPLWDSWFSEMGQKYDVDPNVLLLQAGQESRFKSGAVSPKGAKGFSQFMPGTARRFGVDTSSVKDSIRGQAEYMSFLLSTFGGDYRKALAGYNAGEGAVMKYRGIPPYRETRDYVSKISGGYAARVRGGQEQFGTYQFNPEFERTDQMLQLMFDLLRAGKDGVLRGNRPRFPIGAIPPTAEIQTEVDLSKREKEIDQNKQLIEIYRELADGIFNLNERTKEDQFLRDYKLGKYPQLNDQMAQEIANSYRLIDASEQKAKADEEARRRLEDFRQEQQRLFEDTARGWEDLLSNLATGNFKSIWDQLRRNMLDMFIKPASQYLTKLFGNMGGVMGGQGGGFNLAGLFGGGIPGIGPGGTPNFNSNINVGSWGQSLSSASGGGGSMWGGWDKFKGWGAGLGGSGGGFSMSNLASMIGPQAYVALASYAIQEGLTTKSRWKGFALLGAVGLISAIIRRRQDNPIKKLKEAALSTYGITVKDKEVLNTLKMLGETMFGKGQVGKNAVAVVSSDQGQIILRNYAEATGQSSTMIDRLYMGDENWSGNQFRSKFGGFRAMGGPVSRGFKYVVGERGPEVFTPATSGSISPTVGMGDQQMKVILAQVEETLHMFMEKFGPVSPGHVLMAGAQESPNIIGDAAAQQIKTRPELTDAVARGTGRFYS